nr:polysaccharide biosynthesis C-terminal domain-containing protein [Microbacterium halimionae]
MLKLGQFLPLTLANALQSWTAEVTGIARAHRIRIALSAHAAFGVAGWVVLATAGPWASEVLFGAEAAATFAVVIPLGFAFALYSLRTSMTRHLLFPTGAARTVMAATLIGTVVGVPAMLLFAAWFGPVGAAFGYAMTELIATVLLFRRCKRALKTIAHLREGDSAAAA